jgi:hypothetical protein
MSRLGGMMVGNSRRRPYIFGGTSSGMSSLKALASSTANPGSVPNQNPPGSAGAVTSSPQEMRNNLSDINGTTMQNHPQKYKYKYKYPGIKNNKRKREGGDGYPVDKKLRFQDESESDEDMPDIEPRSVPGDQYAQGASVNMDVAKTKKTTKKKKPQKPTKQVIEHGKQANSEAQYWTGVATTVFEGVKALGGEKLLPPHLQTTFQALGTVLNTLTADFTKAKIADYAGDLTLDEKMRKYGADKKIRELEAKTHEIIENIELPDVKKALGSAYEKVKNAVESVSSFAANVDNQVFHAPAAGKGIVQPTGMGQGPGESYVPEANVISENASVSAGPRDISTQGEEPLQAYGGEEQKAMSGGDPNRTDPITPATGSRQTSATANSLVSVKQLKAAAERTVREKGPEAVHGNARERANMGQGALDTYEFQGPYDYPVYPGGRPDDSLTMMGAWRTNGGNDSSLWYSKKTAKGANAKRNKYFKWSTKGGGRWRKLSKDDMVNVIQKGGQSDNRFYGTRTNLKFMEFQRNRDRNVALARAGNALVVNSEHSDFSRGRNKYIGANKVGIPTSSDVPSTRQTGKLQQNTTEGPSEKPVGSNITADGSEVSDVSTSSSGVLNEPDLKWEEAAKVTEEHKRQKEEEKKKSQSWFF